MEGTLNRSLTLTDLTLFGVASIMGSGGFNLIGYGVRSGGSLWPVALGISAVLLMGSAFTYAGAFDRFKKNTSESDMIRSIFGPWAEGVGATAILVYNLVSIVVILVFCSKMLMPSASWFIQVCLTLFFLSGITGLAFVGIDIDKYIINNTTWVLIGVLVAAAGLGGAGLLTQSLPVLKAPSHAEFMNSLWMFFFVLVGFNVAMKFAEETTNSSDIPTAFYLSNGVSILLTVGVAFALSIWLPGLSNVQEGIALELLFSKFLGAWVIEPFKWVIVLFLLLTTFVVFLATTRYLYGLNDKAEWLSGLKSVNDAKAPWVAIVSLFGGGSVLALLNNTDLLVKITDLGFAVIAAMVAGSVSVADWNEGKLGSAAVSGATGAGFLGLIASAFL